MKPHALQRQTVRLSKIKPTTDEGSYTGGALAGELLHLHGDGLLVLIRLLLGLICHELKISEAILELSPISITTDENNPMADLVDGLAEVIAITLLTL